MAGTPNVIGVSTVFIGNHSELSTDFDATTLPRVLVGHIRRYSEGSRVENVNGGGRLGEPLGGPYLPPPSAQTVHAVDLSLVPQGAF